jgi:hypothetical protein
VAAGIYVYQQLLRRRARRVLGGNFDQRLMPDSFPWVRTRYQVPIGSRQRHVGGAPGMV